MKTVSLKRDSLRIDSLAIAQSSVHVAGVADSAFYMVPERSMLHWKHKPGGDSVRIIYRTLPVDFTHTYYHKNRRLIDSMIVFNYNPDFGKSANTNFADFNQIEYNGSYGRSISLGNNQDVVLSSHLNLQVNGYLLDSIKLEAAITDNTIPFQPEGNTQSLQEFDQIYIRLLRKRSSLQLGDYNLDKPKGYFLNFTKRVQGIYYQTAFKISKHTENALGLSGSVAKGSFARNIFTGIEGNQGPYKLTGNNGEQYFIVLANTERVYINGIVQERGENADYTINYNTGEVSFMARRLITKDARIQVEFEYRSQNYLNSLIYAWDELQVGKKWNIRLNAYSNQDAKNQSYQQNLSGEQKRFLGTIGDSIQNAYYPVITRDTFSASKVLYKKIDTTALGVHYDSVFVYSINPDSAIYNLSFSYVGAGKGDYTISPINANGRVYYWLARINGQHQGDYAPVQLLITPKMQQLLTLSTTYSIDSFKTLNVELGASNTNPNLFSTINNNAHYGLSSRIKYTELRSFGDKDTLGHKPWSLQNDVSYEYVQDKFRAIAPYRNVEFGRDWNVPQTDDNKPNEQLAGVSTKLQNKELGALSYSFGLYDRGIFYSGYRNIVSYALDNKRWHAGGSFNLLTATDTFQHSDYLRPSLYAEYHAKTFGGIIGGLRYDAEHNKITDKTTDSLRNTAFSYDIGTAYLKTPDGRKTSYSLTYTARRDELPRSNAFLQQSHSQTIDLRMSLGQWKNHRISFTGSYRDLKVDDTNFNNQKPEQTLLGRLEYNGSILHNVIQLQTLYEIGSGQEQKRSYTYVEVAAGQGLYTWIDYNGDGVQQSNEFEIAVFADQKKYIRVLTLTNEYVNVHYVNYNQSITIDPSLFWTHKPDHGLAKLASRFTDQASLQISNRLLADQGVNAYNPFISTLHNDNIIITSNSLSNTLYYNRSNAKWGIDYNYLLNAGKQLLTYGIEGNSSEQHTGKLRFNLNPSFTVNLTARSSVRAYESALSDGRTYSVHGQNAAPAITWIYRSVFRITGTLQYDDRKNEQAYGGEHANIAHADLEMRFSKPATGVILVRGGFSQINYNGLTTVPVSYIMLDALQPGGNYTWYANWEHKVTKLIELSLEYEGRKPGTGTIIHTGRMTVRAIL